LSLLLLLLLLIFADVLSTLFVFIGGVSIGVVGYLCISIKKKC